MELKPEQKWEFIKALIAAAPDEDTLGSIRAGPLEDLIYGNSEEFIERIEREAKANEKFKYSLSISRSPNLILADPIREREIRERLTRATKKR